MARLRFNVRDVGRAGWILPLEEYAQAEVSGSRLHVPVPVFSFQVALMGNAMPNDSGGMPL